MSAAEAAKQAARLTDPVEHGLGLLGMLAGMLLGAIVGAILLAAAIASGGTLLIAMAAVGVAGLTAGGGLAGGQLARGLSTIFGVSGITTGMIAPMCSSDTIVGNLKAARAVLDKAMCDGLWSMFHPPMPPVPLTPIAEGSSTVYINGMPAARQKDKLVCSADIKQGEPTVIIGGQTVRLLEVHDVEAELERILGYVALGAAAIELLLLTGGVAAGAICGTVLLQAIGVGAVMLGVNYGLGELGDAMGPGWRDTLQGGFGVATIAYSGYRGLQTFNGRPLINEPVDVVTGEVCMRHVDFSLAAALPLALSRVYVSGMENDGPFGPKWASTWGQELRVERGKAFYVADDGRVVDFPLPGDTGETRNRFVNKLRLARTRLGFAVRERAGQTVRFEREFSGRWPITAIEDANGNRIDFDYDDDGALRQVDHGGVYRLRVESSDGRIRRVAHAGRSGETELARYEYDDRGRLVAVVDRTGLPLRFQHDDASRIVRWDDREGTWFSYTYDDDGRCLATGGPGGLFAGTFEYDDAERTTRYTDSLGNVTAFGYNERYQLVEIVDARGGVIRTEWDERSNKLAVENPLGGVARWDYDGDGNVVRESDPTGNVTELRYDEAGRAVELVDATGAAWKRTYDERGNLVEASAPDGAAWSYTNDARGNLVEARDASGNKRTFGYDAAGLPVWITDWRGHKTAYERDELERVVARVDALGSRTAFDYDAVGRVSRALLPTGSEQRWTYDAEGNLVRFVGADRREHAYRYGPFGLVGEERRPGGGTLAYRYDTEGRIVEVRNERGERYTYEYNATGELVAETDFAGRRLSYEVDAAGRASARVRASGAVTRLERDDAGRLVRRAGDDGDEASFAYDPLGNLVEARTATSAVAFERDAFGRIVREVQGDVAVESTYDGHGLRTRRRASGGESRWRYDEDGSPVSVRLPNGETLSFEHDARGRETSRRVGEGVEVRQEFDALDRLVRQWAEAEGTTDDGIALASAIADRTYRYDEDGNPVETLDARWGATRYEHDGAGRVTAVRRERGASEAYAYDSTGNCVAATRGGRSVEREIGAGDRLARSGGSRYEYDADGRVTARVDGVDGDGTSALRWEFEWSDEGALRSVRRPDGERWRYEYDALGRRVTKSGPRGETRYVWDGDTVAEEIAEDGAAVVWEYEPGGFRPLAKVEGGRAFAFLNDPNGTPLELVAASGEIGWSARTTLWGGAGETGESATACPIGFQGQWLDEETGLAYNRHRYYEPETGRYASPDPIRLSGGTNLYAYVPNPLSWIDPFGLNCSKDAAMLRSNMKAAGQQEPNFDNAAHHMVMSNSTDARMAAARARLAQHGVDINDADNGIFLPRNSGVVSSSGTSLPSHASIHNGTYKQAVHDRIMQANSQAEVRQALGDIRNGITNGTFP